VLRVCSGATTDSMRGLLICPVLLLCSCRGSEQDPVPTRGPEDAAICFEAGAAFQFHVAAAANDTAFASWTGRGPLRIVDVLVEPGDSVSTGDSLASGIDSLVSLELSRARMNLQFAAASAGMHPSAEDSLSLLRLVREEDSLEAMRVVMLSSPESGRIGEPLPGEGAVAMPGAMLIPVISSPESLFVVSAPAGVEVFAWPDSVPGAVLVEPGARSALYSGIPPGGAYAFPGSVAVPRQALRDSGLGSYLVLENGDSMPVMRICIRGDSITVLPEAPFDSRVIGWAPSGEDQ
jgi:hypothetical protein